MTQHFLLLTASYLRILRPGRRLRRTRHSAPAMRDQVAARPTLMRQDGPGPAARPWGRVANDRWPSGLSLLPNYGQLLQSRLIERQPQQ